jgi:hypothetical protein
MVPGIPRRHRLLRMELLEDRSTPSAGTFVEDFTNDTNPKVGGYDTAKDGLAINKNPLYTTGATFVPTPAGGPAGKHSVQITSPTGQAAYSSYVYPGPGGGYASWEQVAEASVAVTGSGYVTFVSPSGSVFFPFSLAPGEWAVYRATPETLTEGGYPIGPIGEVDVFTSGANATALVDDVTFRIRTGSPQSTGAGGVVHVNRFGNGLGIQGDDGNNFVRVELPYDAAGTIRILGGDGGVTSSTRIVAGLGATQIDEYTVEVPDFAHMQQFDEDTDQPLLDDRDILINLGRGADQLQVIGADWNGNIPPTIDDLIVNMGAGDSNSEFVNIALWDTLTFTSTNGQDTLTVAGNTVANGLHVVTGGGSDNVRLGDPGSAVFDGEKPGPVHLEFEPEAGYAGVRRIANVVDTGGGDDTVLVAGGDYQNLTFTLGQGTDIIRFESARGHSIRVIPGAGSDRVELIQTSGAIWIEQDGFDGIRLRDTVGGIYLVGQSAIRIELPTSGTRHRLAGAIYTWNRQTSRLELREQIMEKVFQLNAYSPLAMRSTITFLDFDF